MSRNRWLSVCRAAFVGMLMSQVASGSDDTVSVKPTIRTSAVHIPANVSIKQVGRKDPCRLPSHAHWNGQLGPGCYYLIPGPTCLRALCCQPYGWQPCP